jgi:hypothetical protein
MRITAISTVLLTLAAGLAAGDAAFTVTDQVIVADPPRFGQNLIGATFKTWGHPTSNLWVEAGWMEPATTRVKCTLWKESPVSSGPDFVEAPGAFSLWDNFQTGFWDGASYIAVRYEDGSDIATVVRQGRIASYVSTVPAGAATGTGDDDAGADDKGKTTGKGPAKPVPLTRLNFAERGPELRPGDEIVLTQTVANPTPGSLRLAAALDLPWGPVSEQLRLDPSERCPEGGSTHSLRLAAGTTAKHRYLGTNASHWTRLDPGDYRVRVWVKSDAPGAKLRIQVNSDLGSGEFPAGPQWQAHEFTFAGKPTKDKLGDLVLTASGGTVWVDNLTIARADAPTAQLFPENLAVLKQYRPSVLRFWSSQDGSGTLDSLVGDIPAMQGQFSRGSGHEDPLPFNLPEILRICHETGADPWIIIHVGFTPQEWRDLIEYLAGDATTPYGAKRAASGRKEPWTSAFKSIYLECGNEVWSKIFRPSSWMRDHRAYGMYSHLMFTSAASHPAFAADKFTFVGGDWGADVDGKGSRSFGSMAAELNKRTGATTVAHYTGGFDGYAFDDQGRAEQIRNRLYYGPRMGFPRVDKHLAAVKGIRGGLTAVSYEGGPGYGLPSPGKKFNEEAEQVGKSLASAVATADIYLYAISRGYGAMAAFFLGKGDINWSSHAAGWRPHAWHLALEMRNRWCEGDLVAVQAAGVPTVDIPEATVTDGMSKKTSKLPAVPACPTLATYAFRNANGYDLYVISREIEASRTVSFTLPRPAAGAATLYRLAHADPWANNRSEEMLQVAELQVPMNGATLTLQIPPHSLQVLRVRTGR